MRNLHYKNNCIRKILAVTVILGQIFNLSGCGILSNSDARLKTAPKIGSAVVVDTVSQNPKRSVSHDMTRFKIEGTNAFYIPEGLENDPRDIRSFDLLDYTDDGEFIYHFITPAFITADEVRALKSDEAKAEGDVSTNAIKEPDRSGGQKSDAELLMAYKPETGHYRVLDARGYELEWDPSRQDKPDFFTTPLEVDGGKKGLVFMKERGFACKIPEKEEYFIADMNCVGTVYNKKGDRLFTMDYANDISAQQAWHQMLSKNYSPAVEALNDPSSEVDREFEEFKREKEKEKAKYPDSLKLIITDVAMSREYYSYISCSSYKGSSPFDQGAYLSGFTFVSSRQNLAEMNGGISEFVSVNLNAEQQEKLWSSIEGKYFNSRTEMENDPGYSMDRIKREGAYADNFTPFVSNPTAVSEDAAFIVGSADFRYMKIGGFDIEDMDRVTISYAMPPLDSGKLRWYMGQYDSESSSKRNKLMNYWKKDAAVSGKRGFRSAHGIYIDRLLQPKVSEGGKLADYVKVLEDNGLVPRMGPWNESKRINESQLNEGEITPQSLHVLRVRTGKNGSETPFLAQVDPIKSEAADTRRLSMLEEKVTAIPVSYFIEMRRTCWYYSEREAEEKRRTYKEAHPETAETIDRLHEILSSGKLNMDDPENSISQILNDSSGDDDEAAEVLKELSELAGNIQGGDMQYVVSICAGYVDENTHYEGGKYPVIYALRFPEGAGATMNRDTVKVTGMGKLKGVAGGVLVAYDDMYEPQIYCNILKYTGLDRYTDGKEETPGSPNEVGELRWSDPVSNEQTVYYTYHTSIGIKFYKCNADGTFEPLSFTGEVKDIWRKPLSNGVNYSQTDTKGFIPYEELLVSSGYTKDTENRTVESVDEIIKDAGGKTEDLAIDRKDMDESKNNRYTGSVASADSFMLIGPNEAIICVVNGGTRIVNLESGEVVGESGEGSFYRGIQDGNSNHYKLIGFDTDQYKYLPEDMPMAKVYDKVYESKTAEKIDQSVLDTVCETLRQMAKDFLYRHYRTALDEKDRVVRIDMPESEKKENISEEKLFASGNADDSDGEFHSELLRLEKLYGIGSDPEEIKNYLIYLRKQAAAVKPAITRLYLIAGAASLATSDKREEGYWKNLDSRSTLADSADSLKDILIEIRMHPDVAATLPSEQAEKYKSYRPILDYTAEQGKVTYEDKDVVEAVSEDRIKESYRRDVLKDISDDFEKQYPDADFEETVLELLDKVNPDNLLLKKDGAREEFIDITNKGISSLSDQLYEEMKERMQKAIPNTESVWEMEKLIISEKIRQPKFEKYKSAYDKYEEDAETVEPAKRAALMRKQEFYMEIIGDLKSNSAVKEFLAGKRETWEDYIREVILTAGAGKVKDENGMVEGSLYNNAIEEWRKLSEETSDNELELSEEGK